MTIKKLIEDRYGFATEIGDSIVPNKTLTDVLSRRSCRRFQDEAVEEDLLQTLFATAFSAPSKSDLQQACVIHVRNQEKKQRIADSTESIKWLSKAPVFLVWCGDSRRIRQLSDWKGHAFANDHLDAFMNAAVDVGIAMQTFIVAAESVGLGCCPVSEVRNQIKLLSNELELPQWVFPVAGLCVGWPEEQGEISMRLPHKVTVMEDRYSDTDLLQAVAVYDQMREDREQTPDTLQRMVDEYGISDKYGWSENRTRQYAKVARDDFGAYIRDQGFRLD